MKEIAENNPREASDTFTKAASCKLHLSQFFLVLSH